MKTAFKLATFCVVGATASAGVAACGGTGDSEQGSSATSGAASSKQFKLVDSAPSASAQISSLKWLLSTEPGGLDADRSSNDDIDTVLANVCDRLFQEQPDLTVKPSLASAHTQSDKSLVLTLRKDATFHDGSKVTAQDVVFSLRRHAKEGNEQADEFGSVKSIAKTGPHEVTLALKHPDSQILLALAADAGIIMNKKVVEAQGDDYGTPGRPDGCSGPYTVDSWKAGTQIVLKKFKNYWNSDLRTGPSKVTFTWAESAAQANTLTTGAADGTYLSSPSLVPALKGHDNLSTYFGPSTMVYSLVPTGRGGMKNPKLRRALSLALDRAGIAKAGFHNYAFPADLPIGAAAWGYAKHDFEKAAKKVSGVPTSPTEKDIAKAKDLVKSAGAEGKQIIVASDGSPYRTVIGNAVRQAGQQVGLKVKIQTMSPSSFDEFYSDPSARKKVDLVPVGWYISKADPTGFYDNMITGGGNNWIKFSDKTYDKAIQTAESTTDPKTRAKVVIQAQTKFMDEMLWIPVVEAPNTLVLSSKLAGPPASVAYLYYPWLTAVGSKS